MAQSVSIQQHPFFNEAPETRRRAGLSALLYFPIDAVALRTRFRASVLQTIYELAHEELGNALKSAVVSTWLSLDEPVPPILLLTLWTDADEVERLRVDNSIVEAIVKESASWSDAQKQDYSKTIYFGLEPIDI